VAVPVAPGGAAHVAPFSGPRWHGSSRAPIRAPAPRGAGGRSPRPECDPWSPRPRVHVPHRPHRSAATLQRSARRRNWFRCPVRYVGLHPATAGCRFTGRDGRSCVLHRVFHRLWISQPTPSAIICSRRRSSSSRCSRCSASRCSRAADAAGPCHVSHVSISAFARRSVQPCERRRRATRSPRVSPGSGAGDGFPPA